ncbi:MAG: hypothetical protein ACR2FJ_03350 [Qipengyuania sp.]
MDGDLAMIFVFVIVMVMLVFPFAAIIHRRSAMHEERKLELIARAEEARNGNGGAAYRKLEERVRVLERIATDGNHALAAQIEKLRDLQAIDDQTADRETAQ